MGDAKVHLSSDALMARRLLGNYYQEISLTRA